MKKNRLPQAAIEEMDAMLRRDPMVPADELEAVLTKYKIKGNIQSLQSQYRKRRVQRFVSRYRDKDGCRDILAHFNKERQRRDYITIEKCMSIRILDEIIAALSKTISGYRASVKKAARRRDRLLLLECGYEIKPRPRKRPSKNTKKK